MGLGTLKSLAHSDSLPCHWSEPSAFGEAHAWWRPTSAYSSSKVKLRHLSAFQGDLQRYGQGGYGQPPQQGAPDDYDADADDDPAAEETRAEKEEVLNETLGKAKQVLDVMKRVDIETDASKAQLVEIGAKAIDFKARFRFRNAAAAANTAQEIASHPGEVNQLLSKLSEDAQELQDLMNFTKVGKPFRFRQHLIKLAGDAERASQLMGVKLDKLAEALRMMKHAGGEYVDLTDGEGEVEAPTPAPEDAVQQGGQQHQMDEYGGQEQLGMVGPQAGALHGMPGDVSNPDMAQNAQQMVLEEKMQAAEEAAMSGVTATKEDEQASAEEMESAMEDATWSVDVLPQPQPSDVEPQEPAPAGVPPLPVSETSSGCACDATAKCALQGQPFTWCRIGAEEEPTCSKLEAAQDPTGRNHALGVQGRMWDYCVPPASEAAGHEADANQQQVQQPEKEQTTHVGCECAPRPDVLEKYMEDPLFHNMETGDIDLEKVPFKDRITVEAMQKYLQEGGDLCQQTPSSGQFLACPAAKDCAGSNVAGPGGALPSGWFSGVSGKSWDFCAPSPMQPEQAEEAQHVVGQNGAYGAYEQNSGYNAYGGMPMHMQYQLAPVEMCIVLPPLLKSAAFASKRCLGKEFL